MDVYDAWNGAVEEIKNKVTGVGVWTALNCAVPITYEDGRFVLGFGAKDLDLMGHLKPPGVRRTIEVELESRLKSPVELILLSGITINDWMSHKRQLQEAEKLKRAAEERERVVSTAGKEWDEIYEFAGREYGRLNAKSHPGLRARLLEMCVAKIAEKLPESELEEDEERAFSRAVERIGFLCEASSTLVAYLAFQRAGKL